ncbi:MAG: hypothetical protein H6737_05910 [Alphaproteobacteria bacterium]|nr:hypothetical protein [Alphaproteobacteria bacterium]
MREGRHAEAIAPLEDAVEALAGQADLRDVLARAASVLAQAKLALGDAAGARTAAHLAMRTARELGDSEGLAEIRALDEQVAAALDREKRAALARARSADLAARTTEEVEAMGASPLARADALLKHANALQTHDRPADAALSAARAVVHADAAGSVREQVLARIALAESARDRAEAALHEALAIADRADETTLIGLVARAAELAGVDLPRQYGPTMKAET